jgi:hypothetical protein
MSTSIRTFEDELEDLLLTINEKSPPEPEHVVSLLEQFEVPAGLAAASRSLSDLWHDAVCQLLRYGAKIYGTQRSPGARFWARLATVNRGLPIEGHDIIHSYQNRFLVLTTSRGAASGLREFIHYEIPPGALPPRAMGPQQSHVHPETLPRLFCTSRACKCCRESHFQGVFGSHKEGSGVTIHAHARVCAFWVLAKCIDSLSWFLATSRKRRLGCTILQDGMYVYSRILEVFSAAPIERTPFLGPNTKTWSAWMGMDFFITPRKYSPTIQTAGDGSGSQETSRARVG